jgi:ankyrin repeat protein
MQTTTPASEPVISADTPLHKAVINGNIDQIRTLIAQGADVNACDKEGMTPLHIAAFNDKDKAVTTLLELGANPFITINGGQSALHLAAQNGNVKVLEALAAFMGEEGCDGNRSVVGKGVEDFRWGYFTCIVYPALME